MPTYAYACKDCGHQFDAVQSFSDDALTECPQCQGTLRMLDAQAWLTVGPLLEEIVHAVVQPYGVQAKVERVKGVPPVVNTSTGIEAFRLASLAGGMHPVPTSQSLGGEDFSWYLAHTTGAMARLDSSTAPISNAEASAASGSSPDAGAGSPSGSRGTPPFSPARRGPSPAGASPHSCGLPPGSGPGWSAPVRGHPELVPPPSGRVSGLRRGRPTMTG